MRITRVFGAPPRLGDGEDCIVATQFPHGLVVTNQSRIEERNPAPMAVRRADAREGIAPLVNLLADGGVTETGEVVASSEHSVGARAQGRRKAGIDSA